MLNQYELKKNITVCVKDKRSKLNIMIIALKSIMKCVAIGLDENIQSTCFGRVFSKACQYVITNNFFCKNFEFVSIKYV